MGDLAFPLDRNTPPQKMGDVREVTWPMIVSALRSVNVAVRDGERAVAVRANEDVVQFLVVKEAARG